jgi:hypothetical protein
VTFIDISDWYQAPGTKPRQGDISLVEFHQLRARNKDRRGPGRQDLANQSLPNFGSFRDFEVDIPLPGVPTEVAHRVLRVWIGYAMTLHQNCEIYYADPEDSRIVVAPIATRDQWPNARWDLIERGELPGYLYVPELNGESAKKLRAPSEFPGGAVVFSSTTQLSRGVVTANKLISLHQKRILELQSAIVTFFSVRGWASTRELANLEGKTIVSAAETSESVPGPSKLAKLTLAGGTTADDDEITVVWGLRKSPEDTTKTSTEK